MDDLLASVSVPNLPCPNAAVESAADKVTPIKSLQSIAYFSPLVSDPTVSTLIMAR